LQESGECIAAHKLRVAAVVTCSECTPPAGISETILVVDDEPGVLELINIILSRQGYRILAAESGPKALEIFGRHDRNIDLLLTDVMMPGMSGLALAQRVKALSQDLPVLYMTGGTLADLVDNEFDPQSHLLRKPFDSQSLVRTVRTLLSANTGKGG
jgi:two-component system cell cycle sensor histidine kinase/response regulator CckA